MIGLNLLIALAYVANAIYFSTRFPLPRGKERWALAAQTCAAIFFVTCAATHLGIALAIYHSNPKAWLFSWWMLSDHALQAPAGLIFVVIAWRKLNLTLVSEMEVQRRNLENFRAALMDGAISAIITTDLSGHIIDWNKAAETTFLYSRPEAIGQNVAELIGLTQFDGVCRLYASSGRTITAEVGTRRFDHTGGVRVVAFVRDISQRVEAEEGRRQALTRLLHAEQESRTQIAGELHDDTIQVMAATLMKLDVCEMTMAQLSRACSEESKEQFEDYQVMLTAAVYTLREAMRRTRRMMFELRPPVLQGGLEASILNLACEVDREVHTITTVVVECERQSEDVEKLAYRVILEALTNVRKHAHATKVSILVSHADGNLHGMIEDDGVGFEVANAIAEEERHLHLGILSSQERLKLAGGRYFVISSPGMGTTVSFDIPSLYIEASWQTLYDVIA